MEKKFLPLLCCIVMLFVGSCKKSSAPPNILSGNYNLVNVKAHTHGVSEYVQSGSDYKTETVSDFTSINNGGGMDITSDMMSTVKFTYGVSTTLLAADYVDGQFADSISQPFDFTVPPTSNSSKYQLIGKDSVFFPSGFVNSPNGGPPVKTVAVGAKFVITGNTLVMTMNLPPQVKTNTQSGLTVTITEDGTQIITLQKQ